MDPNNTPKKTRFSFVFSQKPSSEVVSLCLARARERERKKKREESLKAFSIRNENAKNENAKKKKCLSPTIIASKQKRLL